jgi:CRISPR-associated endonuclease/helicase Cas3
LADPSQPAVICGDGYDRQPPLFSGTVTFKSKPLHAAFLGQDALVVHDDAQLEPAFGKLLHAVALAQRGGPFTGADEYVQVPARTKDLYPLRFMELNSVSSGDGASFSLTAADERNPIVKKRIGAKKTIAFHEIEEERDRGEGSRTGRMCEGVDRAVIVIAAWKMSANCGKTSPRACVDSDGAMGGGTRPVQRSPIFQRFLPV